MDGCCWSSKENLKAFFFRRSADESFFHSCMCAQSSFLKGDACIPSLSPSLLIHPAPPQQQPRFIHSLCLALSSCAPRKFHLRQRQRQRRRRRRRHKRRRSDQVQFGSNGRRKSLIRPIYFQTKNNLFKADVESTF